MTRSVRPIRARVLLAVWAGKLTGTLLRLLGRAGTHVPGKVALAVYPGLMSAIPLPSRVVVVTGTNGKTTTTNILADALHNLGVRVGSNRAGSNLREGIISTLMDGLTVFGRSTIDTAVLEMDERSARLVLPGLRPDVLVCTNLTRDSIKRNAHPEYIAWIVSSALSDDTTLVLNADDLITARLGTEANRRVYFGVDAMGDESRIPHGVAIDVSICPICDHALEWDVWRLNHIGKVTCPSCGYRSPQADVRASSIDIARGTMELAMDHESTTLPLVNDNIVNVYNEVAVAAALTVLGVPVEDIAAQLASLKPPVTRFADETIGGVRILRLLTKGLVGVACSRAFEHIPTIPGRKVVLMAIDEASERFTEVENTAWIYDADYEYLADPTIAQIFVGGIRRHDHALRLAIAGVDPTKIVLVESETEAADLIPLDDLDAVFNLHSVHNALISGNPVQQRLRERLLEKIR